MFQQKGTRMFQLLVPMSATRLVTPNDPLTEVCDPLAALDDSQTTDPEPGEGSIPPLDTPKKVELKPLPDNLRYEFLDEEKYFPVIVGAQLSPDETNKLLEKLRLHRGGHRVLYS
jgi:hypothetical protein